MNTEQAMAAAHERLTEIIKSKRFPRKLKKKFKKRGLLNPNLKINKQIFDLLYPKVDLRALPTMLTIDTNPDAEKVFNWSFKK